MKNVVKVLGIIAIVAVIGFGMVSCEDDDGGGGKIQKFSGTAKNGGAGFVFAFSGSNIISSNNDTCKFTTSLPAPDNSFTLESGNRIIETSTQEITWSAEVKSFQNDTFEVVGDGTDIIGIRIKK